MCVVHISTLYRVEDKQPKRKKKAMQKEQKGSRKKWMYYLGVTGWLVSWQDQGRAVDDIRGKHSRSACQVPLGMCIHRLGSRSRVWARGLTGIISGILLEHWGGTTVFSVQSHRKTGIGLCSANIWLHEGLVHKCVWEAKMKNCCNSVLDIVLSCGQRFDAINSQDL